MRVFYRFGVLLIAGWCGCLSTGEQRVDITTPQAEIALRVRDSSARDVSPRTADPQPLSSQRHTVVRVFYGTDRARHADVDPQAEPNDFYSGRRGLLKFGFCHVSIPDSHEYGENERPLIWRFELEERTDQQVMLGGIEPVDRSTFAGELLSDVNESEAREAFVFVHGHNVDFAEAARQTARFAHDLRFDGPPILYSWPSQGERLDDIANQNSMVESQAHLVEFLQTVSEESGARKLHVIAHGTGSQLVAAGLRQMADAPVSGGQPHFNEVILAAADIDAESFRREIAPRIVSVADRVTIYTSDDDQALRASEQVHGATRLGQGGSDLVIIPDVPGIDVVDVASLNFEFFDVGHSTHGNELLSDIRQVFSGAATTQRGLQPHPSRQPAWRLPTSDVQLVSHTEPVDEEQKEEVEEAEESIAPTSNSLWGRVRTWWPW